MKAFSVLLSIRSCPFFNISAFFAFASGIHFGFFARFPIPHMEKSIRFFGLHGHSYFSLLTVQGFQAGHIGTIFCRAGRDSRSAFSILFAAVIWRGS